jgi:dTMP kinase
MPDITFFFDLAPEMAAARGQYGTERFETISFQKSVYEAYMKLRDDSWQVRISSETRGRIWTDMD